MLGKWSGLLGEGNENEDPISIRVLDGGTLRAC